MPHPPPPPDPHTPTPTPQHPHPPANPVFTYGTLLSEPVLHAILGRIPTRQPAILPGYTRHPIRNKCYPAILKSPTTKPPTQVHGMLLTDLTTSELALLDHFEDPRYHRAEAHVDVINHDARCVATVRARVWARLEGDVADLEMGSEWSETRFREVHEGWYVRRCVEWAAVHRVE